MSNISVPKLLAFSLQKGASDLHLSAGVPPMMRLHGEMTRLDVPAMEADQLQAMLHEIMNEKQKKEFAETWDIDFAITIASWCR